ncbi:MAG: hypothetical protein ACLQJR_28555 [Stellaceae bacterium]
MTLLEIFEHIRDADRDLTIYAVKPWTPASKSMLADSPDGNVLPDEPREAGMDHFLDVFVVQDLLEDWLKSSAVKPTTREQCERFIYYAINDA